MSTQTAEANNVVNEYLERHWRMLLRDDVPDPNKYKQAILLVGTGATLDTIRFLRAQGYRNLSVHDVGHADLNKFRLPLPDETADAIIAHAVFNTVVTERAHLVKELKRIASGGCRLLLDLDGKIPEDKLLTVQADLIQRFDWKVLDNRRAKCILQS